MSEAPQTVQQVLEESRLPRLRRARTFRRVVMGLLSVLVLAGLTSVLGIKVKTIGAEDQGLALRVTYTSVTRLGLASPWEVEVSRAGGFDGPVTVATTNSYFEIFKKMGDLIQQGVTQEDFSVTGAMLAVGTISLWILAISYTSYRSRDARTIMEGPPAMVMHNGELAREVMKVERLAEEELLDAAREQGIEEVSQIRYGILEPDCEFSFIRYSSDEPQGSKAAKDIKS